MIDSAPRSRATPVRTAGGLFDQVTALTDLFRRSREKGALSALVAGLAGVIGATAWGQVELNAWNQPFYDAIERRDLPAFFYQLGVYAVIAGALLALNVAQTWLNQTFRMKLREGLTRALFAEWLAPRRAFLLAGAGEIGEHPD